MSTRAQTPALTPGNHIYLYRLLRDALGAGKQTFLPAVEEALAAEHFEAADLGFATTRELLEELDDFISLKVFKGNRIYATVIAQPAWDEALAAGDAPKDAAKAGGKSWKRKKADKTLRAVKPRRVKRPEPEAPAETAPAAEAETEIETAAAEAEAGTRAEITPETTVETAPHEDAVSAPSGTAPEQASPIEPEPEGRAEDEPEPAAAAEAAAANTDAAEDGASPEPGQPQPPEPEPRISLTIVYDPTEDEPASAADDPAEADAAPADAAPAADSAQGAPATGEGSAADDAPTPQPAPEPALRPAPQPAPVSASEPAASVTATPEPPAADYPLDFAREVYCPGDLLLALTHLLPYGADVLGILSSYFDIARLNGTLVGARSRATFPVAYIREGARREVLVTIKRRGAKAVSADGAAWAVASVEHDD
ncbi:hypothetical protein [Collinsella intestinalis]|uniref:hypothetical protein n=1 Tax=Collinsella intestinalis TaxID=147207 RepID=UPI0025A3A2BB|nr:hypothetical protein [Collinsella intestinalis]MDM8162859.1 hypothetical protein [Collinsella intestinalis]